MAATATVGRVVGSAWNNLRRQLGPVALIAFAISAPSAAFEVYVEDDTPRAVGTVPALVTMVFGSTVGLLSSLAWMAYLVADMDDRPLSWRDALVEGSRHVLPVLGAEVLSGLAQGVGPVLCVVPGVYLATRYQLVFPVAYLEPRKHALDRSSQLLEGRLGTSFGLLLTNVALLIPVVRVGGANGVLRNHVPLAVSAVITVLAHLLGRLVTLFRVTVSLALDDAVTEAEAEAAHDAELRKEAEAKALAQSNQDSYQNSLREERLGYGFTRGATLLEGDSGASTALGVSIIGSGLLFLVVALEHFTDQRQDPAFDLFEHYALRVLPFAFGVLVVFRQSLVVLSRRAWEAEKRGLAQLPFPIENAIAVLGDCSHSDRLVLEVHFVSHSVDVVEQARERMTGVDPGGTVDFRHHHLELRGDAERAKVEVVRDARLLFHDLLEMIVLPLQQQEPVARVVVREE